MSAVKHDGLPPAWGEGGGGAHRGISLQRHLTFSISYMSSISGATLVPCWCHPRVAPGGTNMAHPVAVD